MNIKLLAVYLFGALWCTVAAWSPQDREIFTVREQVQKDLGENVTFYDWLEVSPKAKEPEIGRAYRKMSRKLHPDKARRHRKQAEERFARLGVVANILRDGSTRERYDFYLKKGFPKYKGTDYFYSRYRPGLVSVILFLYMFVGVSQFYLLKLGASRDRKRIQNIIDDALNAAGWPFTGGSTSKRVVQMPNNRVFAVYPEGSVFLVAEKQNEYHIKIQDVSDPLWTDTILVRLPAWILSKITGKQYFLHPDGQKLGSAKPKKPAPAEKIGSMRRRK